MATSIAWTEKGITRIVDADELDALREAVEVLEDLTEEGESYRHLYSAALKTIWFRSAALEAVEVLEDMYAQRDAETEKWFQKWIDEYSDHVKTSGALRDAEAKIAELHQQQARGDSYYRSMLRLRERVKTYKATLGEIAAYGSNGGATLARHVLNSEIHDGGSDF